tara:strand:- start:1112 stop:2428 length:1317 start_codon:yes stop_codon:yes gene_type:complete
MTSHLPPLHNIIDSLVIQPAYEERDIEDLRESIYLIIEDFVKNNILEYKFEDFEARIFSYTYTIVSQLHTQVMDIFPSLNIHNYITEGIHGYFHMIALPRSYACYSYKSTIPERDLAKHIESLFAKEQPEQRTHAWFDFRWNHITASNAWLALDSEKNQNQLIYSKCKPINREKYSRININSPMHHGQRYEDLSVQFYENMYNTKVGELGCLAHDTHFFIAGSPDGINIKRNNPRYGRLLEIKNPTTRKLTGYAKKEYWIQMQIQLFVTGLTHCDFLETIYKEYTSEEAFYNDGSFIKTADQKPKGIIVCFHNGKKPIYKYPPYGISKEAYETWHTSILDANNTLTWIQDVYWYLEDYSCITVPFNAAWMKAAIPQFRKIWDIIQKERIEGYEHRKPTKRVKKVPPKVNSNILNDDANNEVIIKIRTESFSSTQNNNN